MRSGAVVAAVVGLLVVGVPAATASPPPGDLPPPANADRDGDGVDDAFAHALADLGPGDRVDAIVTVRRGSDVAAVRRAHGVEQARDFAMLHGFAGTLTVGQVRGLARSPDVVRVQADQVVTTMLEDARADTGTDRARAAYGLDGAGVGVCVVDTGVDPGHEQLDSQGTIPFHDAVNGRPLAYDDHGHGTHVAAIVLGDGTGGAQAAPHAGVAPGASLYAAKVLSSQGSGSDTQVLSGIDWCAAQAGVDIISMSLGGSQPSDGRDAISVAADNATDAGKIVVVAAGNAGSNRQTVPGPGAGFDVVTVGAAATHSGPDVTTTPSWYERPLRNGVFLAPFSSRGPTLATDGTAATRRIKPDVAAPGYAVSSALAGTTSGYQAWNGTSMATPFVSGTLALAKQADPGLTNAGAHTLIAQTSQDRGWAGKDNDWGHGLLDGWALVSAAAGSPGVEPTAYPGEHVDGTVGGGNATWTHTFEVVDDTVPVAVTMLIQGQYQEDCSWIIWCFEVWTLPDLDARLRAPDGTVADLSQCGLGCGNGTEGNQETLTAAPALGTWTLEVWPYAGGPGGVFTVDLSAGLTAGGGDPPPDPDPEPPPPDPEPVTTVHVAGLDGTSSSTKGTWTATATTSVGGADGALVRVHGTWDDGTPGSCLADAGGSCPVSLPDIAKKTKSATWTVTTLEVVSPDTVTWDPGDDVATSVEVLRP